ncbi:unnamed protein product [Eruca vesicaria subsp. sativa]|uniref:Photosystem II core complex proteins psbY, chloroplastic n=1 Tax=Eruca vesicaria subsp. sativa TaxID=29727 RepID=A0ABC8KUZ9_ERUVS|nr:unnamed protein product [Eruca vesicaria subsp. sativa]
MAATMATSTKCMSLPPKLLYQTKPISSKHSITLPTPPKHTVSLSLTTTALAGAVFSALSHSEPALAAHQISELAAAAASQGSDNRGLALLLPIVPAIGWVLFNILQPALNQINKMRESKGVVVGLGGIGGGLAAAGLLTPPPEAVAAVEAAERAGDNRGQLLLFVVAPALLWVLYNILQPALNQLNKMRKTPNDPTHGVHFLDDFPVLSTWKKKPIQTTRAAYGTYKSYRSIFGLSSSYITANKIFFYSRLRIEHNGIVIMHMRDQSKFECICCIT